MISVVLIESGGRSLSDDERAYLCARSMPWLVSAVVGGVARDLVLAVSPTAAVLDLAERVGCSVGKADGVDPFSAALKIARCSTVLALEIGFEPVGDLAAELNRYSAAGQPMPALLQAASMQGITNLFKRPRIVGALGNREAILAKGRAVLHRRRGTHLLATRMRPVD